MNVLDLTPNQLKRAASIKEQIDRLNGELSKLLGSAPNNGARHSRLSPATRRRIGCGSESAMGQGAQSESGQARHEVGGEEIQDERRCSGQGFCADEAILESEEGREENREFKEVNAG